MMAPVFRPSLATQKLALVRTDIIGMALDT
jgi:hypothetical protein